MAVDQTKMGIVVEKVGRSGNRISLQTYAQDRITLGRSFLNHVVLKDPHVDATHLEVVRDPLTGGLLVSDCNSRNGSWLLEPSKFGSLHLNRRSVHSGQAILSGQALQLGKTFVKIYLQEHVVAPTLAISEWEEYSGFLNKIWMVIPLVVVTLVLGVTDRYLDDPLSSNLAQYSLSSLYPIIGALFFAGFWGMIGRGIKHDAKLMAQLSIGLLAVCIYQLVDMGMPYVVFSMSCWQCEYLIEKTSVALISFLAANLTLLFATSLGNWPRFLFALLVPMIIVIAVVKETLTEQDYSSLPPYDRTLVEPGRQWREAEALDAFLERARALQQKESTGSH